MSQFWDARFGKEEYIYGKRPNEFFRSKLDKLPVGRILLAADGEGRNGVFAARKGWEVHAFDTSIEGRKKALALARDYQVSLDYTIESYTSYDPEGIKFDVVALIFAHKPPEMRKFFHEQIVNWLAPGGYVILEAFDQSQLGRNSGGPKDLNLLYNINLLQNDFKGLDILYLEQVEVELDEGDHHRGKAQVVRLVARK